MTRVTYVIRPQTGVSLVVYMLALMLGLVKIVCQDLKRASAICSGKYIFVPDAILEIYFF